MHDDGDDDDLGGLYRALRERSQVKRARNRAQSARLLTEAGIPFVSKNGGAHLIVAGQYDFWPGTGLWMSRKDQLKRRGVHSLIARIRAAP